LTDSSQQARYLMFMDHCTCPLSAGTHIGDRPAQHV
jgi:hypothetical protein